MRNRLITNTIVFFIVLCVTSILIYDVKAKFIYNKEILVANISLDTIIPKIELMNIKNTLKKEQEKENENGNEFYSVNIQIKIIESNIKINSIDKSIVKIDKIETKNYEIFKLDNLQNEIIYEIRFNNLLKNQEIQIIIPEGTVIDNSNNTNNEQIINYIVC